MPLDVRRVGADRDLIRDGERPSSCLLLLDEGLDFLDAATRARFLALLPELTASGTHLLVVAHRPEDAPPGLTHHLGLEAGQVAFCRPL